MMFYDANVPVSFCKWEACCVIKRILHTLFHSFHFWDKSQIAPAGCRFLTSAAAKKLSRMSYPAAVYSITAAYYHWLVAVPLVGSIGCVLKAQQSPKEEKGKWMFRHKSLGLLTGIVVAPRVAYRLLSAQSYNVEKILGTSAAEHSFAKATHFLLYGFMTVMPISGIAMGYYGGNGLPFFWTTIPGIVKTEDNKKRSGQIAKQVSLADKNM